jgi:hypothetical protein
MARNLLQIETDFIRQEDIAEGLQLRKVNQTIRTMNNHGFTRFNKALGLAKLMLEVKTWFETDTTQAKFSEAGVSWTIGDLADKIFHKDRSWFTRGCQVATINDNTIEAYITTIKNLQNLGFTCNPSIEKAIKYSKFISNADTWTPILQAYMSQITPYAEHENLANVLYAPLNWKEIDRVIAEHNDTGTSSSNSENVLSRESNSGNTNENAESNDAPRTSESQDFGNGFTHENLVTLRGLETDSKVDVVELMMDNMTNEEKYEMIEKLCERFELTLNIEA